MKKNPTLSSETYPTQIVAEKEPSLKAFSPLQAIKAYCRDCSGGSSAEVKLCTRDGVQSKLCPLYRYRSGKTGRTRILTEEQKQERSQRMKSLHARGV